jgi:hypothetical protein
VLEGLRVTVLVLLELLLVSWLQLLLLLLLHHQVPLL